MGQFRLPDIEEPKTIIHFQRAPFKTVVFLDKDSLWECNIDGKPHEVDSLVRKLVFLNDLWEKVVRFLGRKIL